MICKKRISLQLFFLTAAGFSFILFFKATDPLLPTEKNPICFYSNELGDHLPLLFSKALKKCTKSLYLKVYSLTDERMIAALEKIHLKGIPLSVYYDPSASCSEKIPFAKPLKTKALMHQKTVIIDGNTSYLGSTNWTKSSLFMHQNLVVGLFSKELAEALSHEQPLIDISIAKQKFKLFNLPQTADAALLELTDALKNAKKSIRILIFTITHPILVQELIHAHKRGVKVEIKADYGAGRGSSKKALDTLRKAGINCPLHAGYELLHHKWVFIDETLFISGSANWTQPAFKKNVDTLFFLSPLNQKQRKALETIWNSCDTR